MFVNDEFMESCDATYDYIDALSMRQTVFVQYPDGASHSVNDGHWRKTNNM